MPVETAPNCYFQLEDYELEWNFHERFDLIHACALGCLVKDWPYLFEQSFRWECVFGVFCFVPNLLFQVSRSWRMVRDLGGGMVLLAIQQSVSTATNFEECCREIWS
jgi:hypothetical protein